MRFDSGEVVKCIHEVPIPSIVVKYGATTGHTFGTVRLFGPAVHAHTTSFIPEQDKVQLHQQLEVFSPSPSDLKFSDEGDSGSLVFLQSDQNIRALGLLVGGTTYGTTIVTPMWAVLSKLDLPLQLLNFASGPCMLPPRNLTLDNVVKDVENLKSNVLELVGHAQQTDQKMSELVEHANQTDQKMSELVEHANQTDQKMSELVEHAHQTDQKMKIIEGKIDQVGNNIDGKLERQHAEVIALLTNRSNNN